MAAADGPIVVKLGGSFAFSRHLNDWLAALAACAGRVIIVPGGGPFADAVRAAQGKMGFDDGAAHHMAVLAMEQYGRALVSLNDALSPAESAEAIRDALARHRVPVWMPAPMVLATGEIEPSWEATSDSLAAWLAGKIGAGRLVLVKHGEFRCGRAGLEELIATGVVDRAFARHLRMSAAEAVIVGPADHQTATAAIRDGAPFGVAIACAGTAAMS